MRAVLAPIVVDPTTDPVVAHLRARIDFLLDHIEAQNRLIEALRESYDMRGEVIKAIARRQVDRA